MNSQEFFISSHVLYTCFSKSFLVISLTSSFVKTLSQFKLYARFFHQSITK